MTNRDRYVPGPAGGARVHRAGDLWTLVLTRDLRHNPEMVWQALVDPEQLREWAPFEADRSLDTAGATVTLTTVGAPASMASVTTVKRSEAPRVLEYDWGGRLVRWELESLGSGTRLTLWAAIDRNYISMGAAGWHICLDVLDHWLAGTPVGRLVAAEALQFEGWQRLNREYAQQFGIS